jgi:hypothetical protein
LREGTSPLGKRMEAEKAVLKRRFFLRRAAI